MLMLMVMMELLDARGGFKAFGCYLAEDYFFAQAVQVCGDDYVMMTLVKMVMVMMVILVMMLMVRVMMVRMMMIMMNSQEQNYKLAICSQTAAQNSATSTVTSFHSRLSRYL